MATFAASQRPRPGTRLSSFLHGESVMDQFRKVPAGRGKVSYAYPQKVHTARHEFGHYQSQSETHPPISRSPSSTRSIIDPLHSPINFSRPMTNEILESVDSHNPEYVHPAFTSPDVQEKGRSSRPRRKAKHGRRKAELTSNPHPRTCFPQIMDRHIRQKMLGCLLSGTLLTIVLTTCTFICGRI